MKHDLLWEGTAVATFRSVVLFQASIYTSAATMGSPWLASASLTQATPFTLSNWLSRKPTKVSRGREERGGEPFFCFSSSLADVALRLGPYMSISCRKDVCTRTQLVHMSTQIEVKKTKNTQDHQTTTTRKSPSQTCVSPEETAKQTTTNQTQKKRGRSPNKTPTKSICQGTQWLDHCISLKNMRQKWIKDHDVQANMKA